MDHWTLVRNPIDNSFISALAKKLTELVLHEESKPNRWGELSVYAITIENLNYYQ